MPQYFFHLEGDQGLDRDEFGVELPDLEAARDEARHTLASLVRDAALGRRSLPWHAFVVADGADHRLATLPFTELMGIDAGADRRS